MGLLDIIRRRQAGPGDNVFSVPPGNRVYAIGDIHGRVDLLQQLQEEILIDADTAPQSTTKKIIYLGDYVDRGLKSRDVLDLLINAPLHGFQSVHLMGNHEDLFLRFMEVGSHGEEWLSLGGTATVASYDVQIPSGVTTREKLGHIRMELRHRVPRQHHEFLNNLELSHVVGDYLFVHAGIRPGVPIERQETRDLLWIRREFLNWTKGYEKAVVHGHSLSTSPEVTVDRIGIDTGAYATNTLTCVVLEGITRRFLTT